MVKLFVSFISIFFFNIGPTTIDSVDISWSFVKEEEGIKLYNRSIDGFEYKEVKVVLDLDLELSKAREYLLNPENIKYWMSGCSDSQVHSLGESSSMYYAVFDAPWPISDRDDFGEIKVMHETEDLLKFQFQSNPEGMPKKSRFVRVPYSKGTILIKKTNDQKVELTYQFLVDRGGNLPAYLKDYLENSSPLNTAKKLRINLESL